MAQTLRTLTFTTVASLAMLAGCRAPGVRAVIDVEPIFSGHDVILSAQVGAMAFSVADANRAADGSFRTPSIDPRSRSIRDQRALGHGAPAAGDRPESRSAGLIPLGWPLEIDLGVGEAPFDDEMHPLDVAEIGRAGFSNSVIRFTWREQLDGPIGIHGTAALSRTQEDPLFESLTAARLSWVALGFHASF